MTSKDLFLDLLAENPGKYISGEAAAAKLNLSRNSIWKAARKLKSEGYNIKASTNKGYCLISLPDIMSTERVAEYLPPALRSRLNLSLLGEVTSTNELMKEEAKSAAPEGRVIIAFSQTHGKGRLGRTFFSPGGSGLYISVLLRPKMPAAKALMITAAAAVAVAEAVEKISGKAAGIKWVNDIYIDGRKLCGILTEASMNIEGGALDYAVLGVGINVYSPAGGFPDELKEKACCLLETEERGAKERIAAEVLTRFFKLYDDINLPAQSDSHPKFLSEYKRRSVLTGKEVTVVRSGKEETALALSIDDDCRLIIRTAEGDLPLSSGEVSVRLSPTDI